MYAMMLLLVYAVIAILFTKANTNNNCSPTDKWMREATLDENADMFINWNFTDTEITILMSAKTQGWILVGFGPNTNSVADIVLGWVSNNKTYLQDRFIDNDSFEPMLDKIKSIELIGGSEIENSTYICFKRKLLACDDQDYTIADGTIDVMWSFGKTDLADGKFQMQSVKKGHKLLRLLGVVYPKPSSKTYTIQGPNVTVNSKQGSTIYWCSYYEIPPTADQMYFVGFDAVVPKQSAGYVHHVVMFSCINEEMAEVYKTIDSQGYNCDDKTNEPLLLYCKNFQAIWTIGVEKQYFPPSSGIPFGNTKTNAYYKLEVHYDLTMKQAEFIDNSAMILYIINEEPKNKLGILLTASHVGPTMVVPPGQTNFTVLAVCQPKCLQQNMAKDGISVIGIYFHGHKVVRKMKLHIFRDNKEEKPFAEENFNFELQGFRWLKDEVKVLQNDTLGIECIYDTTDRNETVLGSTGSVDEMCNVFVLYYPVMNNFGYCGSLIKPENLIELIGIEEIGLPQGVQKCEGPDCQTPYGEILVTPPIPILKPKQYRNETLYEYLKHFRNWTPANVEKLSQLYLGKQNPVCAGKGKIYSSKITDTIEYPSNIVPYENPNSCREQK